MKQIFPLSHKDAHKLAHTAIEAGQIILHVKRQGIETHYKNDQSPVTLADQLAEKKILETLSHICPSIPIVAEEQKAAGYQTDTSVSDYCFYVDALDGTKEFIKGGSDYTVNIGLIYQNQPIFGIIYVPETDTLYQGHVIDGICKKVLNASKASAQSITLPPAKAKKTEQQAPLRIVASRSHRTPETEAFLANYSGAEIISVGSSLKFCLLAEDKADLYPRMGPTSEWDTAAGDAILRAAGGHVTNPDGSTFFYGKENHLNGNFIAYRY